MAVNQLSRLASEVLLPLAWRRIRRWGKKVDSVGPLFPGYLFARFNFERDYSQVRYARGVRELICFGPQPAIVPEWIINQLKARCASGPVELFERALVPAERVMVIDGPFREFEGMFERYTSGQERVAILLSAMRIGARVILPARLVVPVVKDLE